MSQKGGHISTIDIYISTLEKRIIRLLISKVLNARSEWLKSRSHQSFKLVELL